MRIAFCCKAENLFFQWVRAGVQSEVLRTSGVSLVHWLGSAQIPIQALPILKPDGVLLGEAAEPVPVTWQDEPLPCVGFSHALEHTEWPRVVNDDLRTGQDAGEGLLDLGYQTLACVGSGSRWHFRCRRDGVRLAAESRGVDFHAFCSDVPRPVPGQAFRAVYRQHEEEFIAFLRALPGNSGLVCCTFMDAVRVLDLMAGVPEHKVPDSLGLVVADCVPLEGPYAGISHVALDGPTIGGLALKHLVQAINASGAEVPRLTTVPPKPFFHGYTTRGQATVALTARLQAYFLEHLSGKILVEDVARHVGMSRRSLELHLSSHNLPSPHALLLDMRTREAERRLLQSEESVTSIAEACGFGEARAMARRFRTVHGVSPRVYRDRARKTLHPNT